MNERNQEIPMRDDDATKTVTSVVFEQYYSSIKKIKKQKLKLRLLNAEHERLLQAMKEIGYFPDKQVEEDLKKDED